MHNSIEKGRRVKRQRAASGAGRPLNGGMEHFPKALCCQQQLTPLGHDWCSLGEPHHQHRLVNAGQTRPSSRVIPRGGGTWSTLLKALMLSGCLDHKIYVSTVIRVWRTIGVIEQTMFDCSQMDKQRPDIDFSRTSIQRNDNNSDMKWKI